MMMNILLLLLVIIGVEATSQYQQHTNRRQCEFLYDQYGRSSASTTFTFIRCSCTGSFFVSNKHQHNLHRSICYDKRQRRRCAFHLISSNSSPSPSRLHDYNNRKSNLQCNDIVHNNNCDYILEKSSNSNKIRFRARVAYCGTSYAGWQLQRSPTTTTASSSSTVQGEVESALHRRFADTSSILCDSFTGSSSSSNSSSSSRSRSGNAQRRIPVVGAGRTDAGVHARGQAIHFDLQIGLEIPSHFSPPIVPNITEENDKEEVTTTKIFTLQIMPTFIHDSMQQQYTDFCINLEQSLNRLLPIDIRIFDLQLAPYNIVPTATIPTTSTTITSSTSLAQQPLVTQLLRPWDAIQSAKRKWYSYRLALGSTLYDPTERYTRTHFIHRSSTMFSTTTDDCADTDTSVRGNNKHNQSYTMTEHDMHRLRSILKLYEGTHNFCAFGGQLDQNQKKRRLSSKKSSSSSNNDDDYNNNNDDDDDDFIINTIRTITKVELVKESTSKYSSNIFDNDDNYNNEDEEYCYRIDFLLDGALYKMVRNMVGTAMECWYGRLSVDKLVDMLQIDNNGLNHDDDDRGNKNDQLKTSKTLFRRKDNPCKPAPPEGLTLECVYYDDGF